MTDARKMLVMFAPVEAKAPTISGAWALFQALYKDSAFLDDVKATVADVVASNKLGVVKDVIATLIEIWNVYHTLPSDTPPLPTPVTPPTPTPATGI